MNRSYPFSFAALTGEISIKKRVRQLQIAQASGVSVATVSRVLSRAPGISDDVRAKVLHVARDLGYIATASDVHTDKTMSKVILFVGATTSPSGISSIYNQVIAGIRDLADPAAITVQFAMPDADGQLPEHVMREPNTGFLFLGIDPHAETLRALRGRGVPVVLVNGLDADLIVDSVSPANFFGGRMIARHLIDCGYQKILQVTNLRRWTLRRRSEGFIAGLKEFGNVETRIVDLADLNEKAVYDATDQWLPSDAFRPDAIFCGNDLVALTVLQTLKGRGFRVPDDLGLVGFDDLPVAEMADPPMTTIRIEWRQLGIEAMRMMLLRHASPDAPSRQLQCSASLIARASTQQR